MSSEGEQQPTEAITPNNASDTVEEPTRPRRQPFNNRRSEGSKFNGKIDEIESLTTKDESKKNYFTKFKSDILQYVLKHFSSSTDIVPAIKAGKNPVTVFNRKAPLKKDIQSKLGLQYTPAPVGGESDSAKLIRESINKDADETVHAIWHGEIKMFVQRGNELKTNMAKLWSIIKDQFSHSLKEALRVKKDYLEKEASYDIIWLLKTL